MHAEAYPTTADSVGVRWWVDRETLRSAMQRDGRYLLVTNDFTLWPQRMLELYRAKDGLEKRFQVSKQNLLVRPFYVHSDERIEGLLLINMLALLVYSLLERQARRKGLAITTRRLIEQLDNLSIIETYCWDGSVLYRLTPVNRAQAELITILSEVVNEVSIPHVPLARGDDVGRVRLWPLAPPLARLAVAEMD